MNETVKLSLHNFLYITYMQYQLLLKITGANGERLTKMSMPTDVTISPAAK